VTISEARFYWQYVANGSVAKSVNALTLVAAVDLTPFNIRINAVGSGLVGTPIGFRDNVNRPSENPRIPLGHIGDPQNVAPMADLSINST